MALCKCNNCKYTRRNGGYKVCMAKLDEAMRHDDELAKGRPRVVVLLLAAMVATVYVSFYVNG